MRWRVSIGLLLGSLCYALSVAQPAPLDSDTRLNQKLSLSAAGMSIQQLFQKIGRATGVQLRAHGALREYRVILYMPERPLRELMTHLTIAFGAEWTASDDNPPVYTLRLLPVQGQTRQQQLARKRREQLTRMIRSLYEYPTPDDFEEWSEEERESHQNWQRNFALERLPLQVLARLTEPELNALSLGKTLEFSSRSDPRFRPEWLPQWKEHLQESAAYLAEVNSTPKGDEILSEYYSKAAQAIPDADEVRLRLRFDPTTGDLRCAVGLFAQGKLAYGETFKPAYTAEEPSPYADPDGDYSLPDDHPWARVVLIETDEEKRDAPRDPKLVYAKLPPPPPLSGDWFHYEAQVILSIARAMKQPFIAEYYPFYGWNEQAMWDFVVTLAEAGYDWQATRDGWMVMRHKDRAAVRAAHIPEQALRRWFYKPRQRGMLTINDLFEMARYDTPGSADEYIHPYTAGSLYDYLAHLGMQHGIVSEGEPAHLYLYDEQLLTLPQVHHGLLYAMETLEPLQQPHNASGVLPLLSEAQRQALLGGQALSLSVLSREVRQEIYRLMGAGDPARVPAFWSDTPPQGSVRLVARNKPIGLHQMPPDKARQVKDIESAKRLWEQLTRDDYMAYYQENAGVMRRWYVQVEMDGERAAFPLLNELQPLLYSRKLPPTPESSAR